MDLKIKKRKNNKRMERVQQMMKVQKEGLENYNNEKECYESMDIKIFNDKIKNNIIIKDFELKIIDKKKLRKDLLDLHICSGLNISKNLEEVQKNGLELFKKKNKDYGDAFATYGVIGILVRIGDKLNRLITLLNMENQNINYESINDTIIDIHNYSIMGIMLMDEKEEILDYIDNIMTI